MKLKCSSNVPTRIPLNSKRIPSQFSGTYLKNKPSEPTKMKELKTKPRNIILENDVKYKLSKFQTDGIPKNTVSKRPQSNEQMTRKYKKPDNEYNFNYGNAININQFNKPNTSQVDSRIYNSIKGNPNNFPKIDNSHIQYRVNSPPVFNKENRYKHLNQNQQIYHEERNIKEIYNYPPHHVLENPSGPNDSINENSAKKNTTNSFNPNDSNSKSSYKKRNENKKTNVQYSKVKINLESNFRTKKPVNNVNDNSPNIKEEEEGMINKIKNEDKINQIKKLDLNYESIDQIINATQDKELIEKSKKENVGGDRNKAKKEMIKGKTSDNFNNDKIKLNEQIQKLQKVLKTKEEIIKKLEKENLELVSGNKKNYELNNMIDKINEQLKSTKVGQPNDIMEFKNQFKIDKNELLKDTKNKDEIIEEKDKEILKLNEKIHTLNKNFSITNNKNIKEIFKLKSTNSKLLKELNKEKEKNLNGLKESNKKMEEMNIKENDLNKKELELKANEINIKEIEEKLLKEKEEIKNKLENLKSFELQLKKKENEINNREKNMNGLEVKLMEKENEINNKMKNMMKLKSSSNENELNTIEKNLKDREIQIKEKEKQINERTKFLEQMEYEFENQQSQFNKEKKNYTDNFNNLKKEIENLNKKKIELENSIKMQMEQLKNLTPKSFNTNNNLMNMNMGSNMNSNTNNNMNINMNNNMNNNIMNNMAQFMNNMMMNPMNFPMFNNNTPMNNMNNMNFLPQNNMNVNMNQINNQNLNPNSSNNNNNVQNNQNKKSIKRSVRKTQPLDFYKEPTLIGLQNIGATCFMNATLQCLSQTEDLTNYFLDGDRSFNKIMNNNIALKNKNDLQLSPVYLELVKNLWNKNNIRGYFEPKRFMITVEEMNPVFKLGQAGDSKDFIIFILEQFHNELKKVVQNNTNDDNITINQYNQQQTFAYFFEEFKKQTSIISDIFFGIQETNNICLNCKNYFSRQGKPFPICYNYQIFNNIIFPLQEVKNYRYSNNNRINAVTLEDCFYYNQKTDLFTGDNKNYCNICKQTCDSNYTSKIYSAPNTLVLILNRGKNNCFNVKLNFTETLDITDFVSVKPNRIVYDLYGVITHYGESGPSAHFLAFCKSYLNNKWYRYNDAVVTEVKNVQKDVIDFANPYILFYKQQN